MDYQYCATFKKIKRIIMTKEISKDNFRKEVIESLLISLVQFKTEWSGVSHIIEPVYNDLAKSYNGVVNFYTVDIEKEVGLDYEYGVMELPTILFFKAGRVIDHAIGLTPKNVLISKIENAISITK